MAAPPSRNGVLLMAEAPGLVIEKRRLSTIGNNLFLGIIGDSNHSFGYHLADPPAGDYSKAGAANAPVGPFSCAIDISMNWAASRTWLRWLIGEIAADRIKGISEVIGSYDGKNVRYWSDSSGWSVDGVKYEGTGHDTWSHVGIYRSTANTDHKILDGWTATGNGQPSTPATGGKMDNFFHGQIPAGSAATVVCTPWNKSQISFGAEFGKAKLRVAEHVVNVGWVYNEIVVSNTDNARVDLPPRDNVDRRSVLRIPINDKDKLDTPVGYMAWW